MATTIGSLEYAYAEAEAFAKRFRAPYIVYEVSQPGTDAPSHFAVMPKRYYNDIKAFPTLSDTARQILLATAVIVTLPNKTHEGVSL